MQCGGVPPLSFIRSSVDNTGGSMFSVLDLIILTQLPSIGSARVRALVSHFGDPSAVLRASVRDLAGVEGISRKIAQTMTQFIRSHKFDAAKSYAEKQLSRMNRTNGRLLTYWDRDFPDLMRKIYDPPPFFFLRGELKEADADAVAIVGTRTPSSYGAAMAEKFARELVETGITVVSGLARGVDTIAHGTALKAGGRTLAVIGSGLDVCYPPENRHLFENVCKCGAVLSEFEMGAKPDAVNFPRRNRIISGLSLGVVIIETDVTGGAMITANTALDQNREVFAVPGTITSKQSRGCHALIKSGRAKLVETLDDVLEEIITRNRRTSGGRGERDSLKPQNLNLFERTIYDSLGAQPVQIDVIAECVGMPTADVLVHLLGLEFKNCVKQLPGKMFIRL
jgi:DNA processing protein